MSLKTACLLPLATVVLLAGCVDDRASYMIDGRNNALTIIREQRYFWDKQVDLAIISARLPDCQRRHPLAQAPLGKTDVTVYQAGSGTYIVDLNGQQYLTETTTCEGFKKVSAADLPNGPGEKLGDFLEEDGKYQFVPVPPAPAAPATASPPAPATEAPAAAESNGTTPPAAPAAKP